MKKIFIFFILMTNIIVSQIASDNAGNYATWTNGSNSGSGFTNWDLWTQNTAFDRFAGHFLGSSTAQGFGNINTSDKAFGMYGNPEGGFPQANAQRGFNYTENNFNVLQDGNTFSIQLAVAFRSPGYKGIDLMDDGFQVHFNFNVTGDQYLVNGVDLNWDYSQTSIFTIEVTQNTATQIFVRVTRGDDVWGPTSITTDGRIGYFKCYVGNTASGDLNNLFFNNLSIRDNAPLPVELTSFSASLINNEVNLNWATATEIDNYGFEVQRTEVGYQKTEKGWETIGFVEGFGNSNSVKEYSYTDKNLTNGKYSYRLKQIDNDGAFKYSDQIEIEVVSPTEFALLQNFPNPFNPSTIIEYVIASDNGAKQSVQLKVYDILGNVVATLVNEEKEAGVYKVEFNGNGLSNGVYFYQLQAGEFTSVKKMVLLK